MSVHHLDFSPAVAATIQYFYMSLHQMRDTDKHRTLPLLDSTTNHATSPFEHLILSIFKRPHAWCKYWFILQPSNVEEHFGDV